MLWNDLVLRAPYDVRWRFNTWQAIKGVYRMVEFPLTDQRFLWLAWPGTHQAFNDRV